MGRAKVRMELISKEKTRSTTFKKRKNGLMKKAFEFTTLCDVSTCIIIYGPNSQEPEIWPSNPDQVNRILTVYKEKQQSDCGKRNSDLTDFFEDRKKKIQEELVKARKRNMEAKYPTWFDFMNNFSEAQLREFSIGLEAKLEAVKTRVEFIKGNNNGNFQGLLQPLMVENKIENFNMPIIYPSVDQGHLMCPVNINPMMMPTMSDINNPIHLNNGSSSCSNNLQFGPLKREICYDSMVENTVVCNNPNRRPLMHSYAPPMPPFMQCTLMPAVHHSQLNDYDGGGDLQMNNQLRGRF